MDTLKTVAVGSLGLASAHVTPALVEIAHVPAQDWVGALTQIVIAIVTVFKLFSKKK